MGGAELSQLHAWLLIRTLTLTRQRGDTSRRCRGAATDTLVHTHACTCTHPHVGTYIKSVLTYFRHACCIFFFKKVIIMSTLKGSDPEDNTNFNGVGRGGVRTCGDDAPLRGKTRFTNGFG